MKYSNEAIEAMIYKMRGQNVMIDSDLAKLYGVETGPLNRQVRRNLSRFPDDFLIEPNSGEIEDLRCQLGIANTSSAWKVSTYALYRKWRCNAIYSFKQ